MAGELLPILVVAGNYRQFCDWCMDQQISQRSPLVKYVGRWDTIRGRRGNPYVLYGTYFERRDIHEIQQALRIIEAIELPRKYWGDLQWLKELSAPATPSSPTSTPTSSPSS